MGNIDETLKSLKHFLTHREQRVVGNGMPSDWKHVNSGLRQGSVLGPILFIIDVNLLTEAVASSLYFFLDYTNLLRTIHTKHSLKAQQKDLTNLADWSEKDLLKLQCDNCVKLTVWSSSSLKNRPYLIQLLNKVATETDLGITIDRSLNFSEHSASIIKKSNCNAGSI